jgi:hypothetical protein
VLLRGFCRALDGAAGNAGRANNHADADRDGAALGDGDGRYRDGNALAHAGGPDGDVSGDPDAICAAVAHADQYDHADADPHYEPDHQPVADGFGRHADGDDDGHGHGDGHRHGNVPGHAHDDGDSDGHPHPAAYTDEHGHPYVDQLACAAAPDGHRHRDPDPDGNGDGHRNLHALTA